MRGRAAFEGHACEGMAFEWRAREQRRSDQQRVVLLAQQHAHILDALCKAVLRLLRICRRRCGRLPTGVGVVGVDDSAQRKQHINTAAHRRDPHPHAVVQDGAARVVAQRIEEEVQEHVELVEHVQVRCGTARDARKHARQHVDPQRRAAARRRSTVLHSHGTRASGV